MIVENKSRVVKLKRLFFLVSLIIAIVALVLFLLDFTIYGIACVGVFALWFLYFQVIDYQYIKFSDENNKILLRYYKAVTFGKAGFNSIEFPKRIIQNAYFENSMFGKLTDLTFIVKTKRGIAEYPSVSLTALPKEERKRIQNVLNEILGI
jgi:prepilin signal peptidase PulO-like enzyme (type II secretory pathway)